MAGVKSKFKLNKIDWLITPELVYDIKIDTKLGDLQLR